jgi:hypothetical protein
MFFGQPKTIKRVCEKIGRNEICPCESGLKYKRCCLRKKHAEEQRVLTAIHRIRDEKKLDKKLKRGLKFLGVGHESTENKKSS